MSGYLRTAAIVGGTAVGGTVAVVAAPLVVAGLGFGAGGIVAGSTAASMMSWMAPTAAGGIVATLQSVGAAGLGLAGTTAVAATGVSVGAGVGGAATYLAEIEVGKTVITKGSDVLVTAGSGVIQVIRSVIPSVLNISFITINNNFSKI